MATFVKEYDWMWLPSGLNLSPAECRVYAYIYGLTESKHSKTKGYNGSVRQLAKDLGLNPGHVSRILHKLQDDNRIVLTGEVWASVALNNSSVALCNDSVALNNTSVASSNESVASCNSPLTTPLYKEINKEMERDNNIARNTIATQTPNPSSDLFEDFISYYRLKFLQAYGRSIDLKGKTLSTLREQWDGLTSVQQRILTRDVKSGKWFKGRPEWIIYDYRMPPPTDYNGSPDIKSLAENNDLVVAVYERGAGIYTRQDAEDYEMIIKRPFKF